MQFYCIEQIGTEQIDLDLDFRSAKNLMTMKNCDSELNDSRYS